MAPYVEERAWEQLWALESSVFSEVLPQPV
jgi:hypothetical protein